jgi:hypothetical protein
MWGTVISTRSVKRGYNVPEIVKKRDRRKESVGREPPFREDLRLEAEDYPSLEAVTRQLLVKTLLAEKTCEV